MEDSENPHVLVVEDNVLERALLKARLTDAGYEPHMATDGVEALEVLQKDPDKFDVVLLDRNMPRMNGMELLAKMKDNPRMRLLPVIMQTAAISPAEVLEGIKAGAYYYLTKPYDTQMLLSVVRAAANDYAEYKEIRSRLRQGLQTLRLLREAVFSLQTVEEARDIASILAQTCPEPGNAVVGLTEILLNAVEHGNLGLSYDDKTRLDNKQVWREEIERRNALPENKTKRVEVRYDRLSHEIRFTIKDQGNGFDSSRFMEIDPARAFDTHGRGIAMALRLSFDSLEYRGSGNEVVATVKLK